jgi:alkaline phosphatase
MDKSSIPTSMAIPTTL